MEFQKIGAYVELINEKRVLGRLHDARCRKRGNDDVMHFGVGIF